MINSIQFGSLFAAAMVAVTVQRPAPRPLPDKPLRQLDYNYSVDYQRSGGSDTGEISTRMGAARTSYNRGTGRQGKLHVDVMAVPMDGGIVLRVWEWPDTESKPEQAFLCAVYRDTRVVCPASMPVTDAETTLMTFLAHDFVDSNAIDGNNHWHQMYSNEYVDAKADFTVTAMADDGKLATIVGHSVEKSANGVHQDWIDDSKIVYDLTKEVPTLVHVSSKQASRGNSMYSVTMDFSLTKDSL